ncbi:MAG: AsmA-like C-terminal region-containing protein [Rhodobacteraceae bacterium]|nr:AsmA-like C-terminal region-containing protein [Paracoccaceae bacterium]
MTDQATGQTPRRRRRTVHRIGLWSLVTLGALAGLVLVAALALTGRTLPLPGAATAMIETRLEAAFAPYRLTIGGGEVVVARDGTPRISLRDVAIDGPGGEQLVRVAQMRARLAPARILRGAFVPTVFDLSGGEVRLLRRADGSFDLAFGGGLAGQGTIPQLIDRLDRLTAPGTPLARLDRVTADGLTITLEDARSGRVWTVTDGRVGFVQTPEALTLDLSAEVFNGTETLAGLQARLAKDKTEGGAGLRVTAAFRDATAADIAAQTPALAALAVLDARVSGSVEARFGDLPAEAPMRPGEPGLVALTGTLDLGEGALRPAAGAAPVPFRSARAALAYDAAAARVDLSDLTLDSDLATARATGTVWLTDLQEGWPRGLTAQVRLTGAELHPMGLPDAVRLDDGWLDFALALDPFTLRVGQATLHKGDLRLTGRGTAAVGAGGWQVAADLSAAGIDAAAVLPLWPPGLAPGTRGWVERNLRRATIDDANLAVRARQGARPVIAADLRFADARARVHPALPEVDGARGHAVLDPEGRFVVVADAGRMTAPAGGVLDVAGTVFQVADVRQRPGQATLDLRARGGAEAALSVLALPPVRLAERVGLPVNVADGQVVATARVTFPMGRNVPPSAIDWQATARLTDVASDRLVPGRALRAAGLDLVAARGQGVEIAGTATLDGVPVTGRFVQGMAPDRAAPPRVEGSVTLTPEALAAFGIALPPGTLAGEGTGMLTLDLPRGEAPSFRLTSDLAGLTLALPQVGWRKDAGTVGTLEVVGRLGPAPEVTQLRLDAPGLTAEGRMDLVPGGGMQALRLSRVQIGRWLDGAVTLTARDAGAAPAVTLAGGALDLRRLPDLGANGGAGRGDAGPLTVALDRVTISDGIRVDGFRGDFAIGRGGALSGGFDGRLNGGTPIRGRIDPAPGGGTAVRVVADDAGSAARDAGIFRGAAGGALDLTLVPDGAPGQWRGEARITDIRLRDAPAMAQLLSAVSVVGLLEQMGGSGIPFGDVTAQFRIRPGLVRLDSLSAEGPSLGLSLDGVYDTGARRIDLQGTVSPVYFLNAIGQAVSSRAGEGLFGVSFRMTGPADAPQVSVNPLSILTPGSLRDIFRRPPDVARDLPPG